MEAYVKPFPDLNRLFVKIKNLESEDQADFILKSAIAGLRLLEKDPDLIFDLRGYKLSEVNFEYEYMRRFLLVMSLKLPRSVIRIGDENFLKVADEVIKELNVSLDSYIITSDTLSGIKEKLKNKGEDFQKLCKWFDEFDFETIKDDIEDNTVIDPGITSDLDQPAVEIKSLSVIGDQKVGSPLEIKVDARIENKDDIYFRYYYKQNRQDKYSSSYNFADDH